MKNLTLVFCVLLIAVTFVNGSSKPQQNYVREYSPIEEADVVSANIINSAYLSDNDFEFKEYVMMHVLKYKMCFPQIDYSCVKNELEKLEEKGKTNQIRLMAHLTKICLENSVEIKNSEKLIKMMDVDLFYSEIFNQINKNNSDFLAFEEFEMNTK